MLKTENFKTIKFVMNIKIDFTDMFDLKMFTVDIKYNNIFKAYNCFKDCRHLNKRRKKNDGTMWSFIRYKLLKIFGGKGFLLIFHRFY